MPELKEVKVGSSAGMKFKLANYTMVDLHGSQSETWDVSDMNDEDAEAFAEARAEHLRKLVGDRVANDAEETMQTSGGS